ncbi:MAG: DUF1638 domain-containing protein [Planctomycetaceae bacterium]|nr:DUF1638 domain-containing protein [Planctomycetaceae bacterium]
MATRKLLSCEVMRDEVEWLLGQTGLRDSIEVEFLEMGLHQRPERLKAELERRITACEGLGYDAIMLMFGLCSNAVTGLRAPADSRLVLPRVHDCISVYLGSTRRYMTEHAAEPGTYWFSRGFLHRSDGVAWEDGGLGADFGGVDEDGQRLSVPELRARYIEEYGEDNADYLIEVLVDSWKANYKRAVYLEWSDYPGRAEDRDTVQRHADKSGWEFYSMPVDLRLLEGLLAGRWSPEEYMVVGPGERLIASNDEQIFSVVHNGGHTTEKE